MKAGKIELEDVPFDLYEQIENVGSVMGYRVREKKLGLACRIAPEVYPFLVGDPAKLRQIFINLLGNAIKFTREGEIVLEVLPSHNLDDSETLQFCIKDTGIGIPLDKSEEIFNSFSKIDDSETHEYGGVGLGLTISKRLIELLGGQIWIESKEGHGTKVFFTARFRQSEEKPPSKLTLPRELQGIKVLVVDESLVNRCVFDEYLSQWGAKVNKAENGKQAIEQLTQAAQTKDPYRLVLLSEDLTDVSCYKVIELIKGLPTSIFTKVILLVSGLGLANKSQNQKRGVSQYVTKPVRRIDLLERIVNTFEKEGTREGILISGKKIKKTTLNPLQILTVDDIDMNLMVVQAFLKNTPVVVDSAENGKKKTKFRLPLLLLLRPILLKNSGTNALKRGAPIFFPNLLEKKLYWKNWDSLPHIRNWRNIRKKTLLPSMDKCKFKSASI